MKHGLATAAVLAVPGTGGAQSAPADPEQTRAPLALLLAAANEAIPAGSSCAGEYGQRGRPRLRDLLSMRLAYLHRGANVITGSCQGSNTDTAVPGDHQPLVRGGRFIRLDRVRCPLRQGQHALVELRDDPLTRSVRAGGGATISSKGEHT